MPASARAVVHRRDCDLLVVHSRRERDEFVRLAAAHRPRSGRRPRRAAFSDPRSRRRRFAPPGGTDLVFAAQAKVPPGRADRETILLALSEVRPPGSAVVKVRALAGEQQTHHEELPYADLWVGLSETGRVRQDGVRFAAGSMRTALDRARSLVTVSSTAALEAIDRGVPVVVLSDFGVDDSLINTVFRELRLPGRPGRRARRSRLHPGRGVAGRQLLPPRDRGRPGGEGDRAGPAAGAGSAAVPEQGPATVLAALRETARLLLPARVARWLRRIRPAG